jgi:hypothetical protein
MPLLSNDKKAGFAKPFQKRWKCQSLEKMFLDPKITKMKMPMSKEKTYKKGDLRKALENKMQEYWNDPTIKVAPMEFSRMLKAYCEEFELPDEIRRAKELEEPLVDAFGSWLGYPLH